MDFFVPLKPLPRTGVDAAESSAKDVPHVVMDMPDRCVIYKPPGWEVERTRGQQGAGGQQLSDFIQEAMPEECRICFDANSSFGFLHRLDVSSSGLILTAKTYCAYHDLELQLQNGEIDRDYIVLCRGFLAPSRRIVDLRVLAPKVHAESSPSLVDVPEGRPSFTALKVLAHVMRHSEAFSLLALRIGSGRRHQIRAHLAHIGHPTVCDWLYSAEPTFLDDKEECRRNFLHRQCLGFKDEDGEVQDVLSPLPAALSDVLSLVRPKDAASAQALENRSGPCSWDDYELPLKL